MEHDYVIVGCGPCAMALCLMLGNTNQRVLVLEADEDIGGCWKTSFLGNYYTEHAPKVMFDYLYFNQMLMYLGIDPSSEYSSVYGSRIETLTKFMKFITTNMGFSDITSLIKGYISYLTGTLDEHESFEDWMRRNELTPLGYKALEILSIAAANIPSKVSASVFFGSLATDVSIIKQLRQPTKWIETFKARTAHYPNITFKCNENVVELVGDSQRIHKVMSFNTKTHVVTSFHADQVVLCTPLHNVSKILRNSKPQIRNNWMPYEAFNSYCEDSSYTGIGFQFHFDYTLASAGIWCWSCKNDWSLIVLDISKYRDHISHDPTIKTVWSGCIIDLDSPSSALGMTAHQCTDKESLLAEVLRQLRDELGHDLAPKAVTLHPGVTRSNGKWITANYSFSSIRGPLPNHGKLHNLYSLGPHTINEIANMETAVKSAVMFGNEHHLNTIFHKQSGNVYLMIIILILLYVLNKWTKTFF